MNVFYRCSLAIYWLVIVDFIFPEVARADSMCEEETIVAIGGIAGFDDLVNPESTDQLRAFCQIRLYIHTNAWLRASEDTRKAIAAIFSGPQDVEFGLWKNPQRFFRYQYARDFESFGIQGENAFVNGLMPSRMDGWRLFVDEAKKAGYQTVSPVVSPNSNQYREHPFDDEYWDYVREAARYGGGLITDAPSDFFWNQRAEYRRFIVREIQWTNKEGLHSGFIISPGRSGDDFLSLTQKTLSFLKDNDALPGEFVVENYKDSPRAGYRNTVGDESEDSTIASVALWLVSRFQKP